MSDQERVAEPGIGTGSELVTAAGVEPLPGESFGSWFRRRALAVGQRSVHAIDRRVAPVFRDAAVLAPFWNEGDGVRMALTLRSSGLSAHSGQISFPGGSSEPGETLLQTALRETEEELGIGQDLVQPAGELDEVWSLHGFIVRPYLGWLHEQPEFRPSPVEVERVIVADLEALMDPSIHRLEVTKWKGLEVPIHYFDYEGDVVWGMTAAILARFFSLLRGGSTEGELYGEESLKQFLAKR